MKCIVTAGPTYEELDEVRRLTNFSTGALGTALADFLAGQGHDVTLLRGHYSTCPPASKAQRTQVFTTTADLSRRLQRLGFRGVGAVFHAAAVSDFAFGKIWRRAGNGHLNVVKSRKISTRHGSVLAELSPTPKIIGRLREWFPRAVLVGWKYEVDGARAAALAEGKRQLEENRTDACVVNGPAYGRGFGLLTGPEQSRHLADKAALLKALAHLLKTP